MDLPWTRRQCNRFASGGEQHAQYIRACRPSRQAPGVTDTGFLRDTKREIDTSIQNQSLQTKT